MLVEALRAFGEMPLEGGAVDPLIDVMNSLAHRAADRITDLETTIRTLIEEAMPTNSHESDLESGRAAWIAAMLSVGIDPETMKGGVDG